MMIWIVGWSGYRDQNPVKGEGRDNNYDDITTLTSMEVGTAGIFLEITD